MYESMRNEMMAKLSVSFPAEDIKTIITTLDRVMLNYDVSRKETALQLYDSSIIDALKMYLVCKMAAGMKEASLNNTKYTIKRFANTIGKPLSEVTTNDIRGYLFYYQKQNNTSPATMEKIRQRLDNFFDWCAEEGMIKINPVKRVAKISAPRSERRALTAEELEFCRNQCKTLREKALLEVLFSTGARVSEIANLDRKDIDWANGSAKVFGKNSEYYTVYFNAKARVTLKAYLKSRTDTCPALFVTTRRPARRLVAHNIRNEIEAIGKRAEIETVLSPHVMRHTMATMALQHGTPLEIVQRMLNHKSPATTQIYAEMDRTTVEAAHRRAVI